MSGFSLLSVSDFATHSFRVAAGSLLQREKFSDSQMRQLGRWRSNNFEVYSRPSWLTVRQAHLVMASVDAEPQVTLSLDRPYHTEAGQDARTEAARSAPASEVRAVHGFAGL